MAEYTKANTSDDNFRIKLYKSITSLPVLPQHWRASFDIKARPLPESPDQDYMVDFCKQIGVVMVLVV